MTTLTPSEAAEMLMAPYVYCQLAPLHSVQGEFKTLSISVSLDDRGAWTNGIYQNSRYGQFFIHQLPDGRAKVELLSRGHKGTVKMRKVTVKSTKVALAKIQQWIEESTALQA